MSDTCKTEIAVPVRPIFSDETIELEEFGFYAKKAIDNYMAGKLSIEEFFDEMQMKDKTFLSVNTDAE
uniref:CopG family transcriptional regulator n=1 Tax=Strongyloides venezuelensis TaxID=75913 RepID=A0A0K0EXX4_STRVS